MKARRIILLLTFIFMFANAYSYYYDSYYGSIAIDPNTGANGYCGQSDCRVIAAVCTTWYESQ